MPSIQCPLLPFDTARAAESVFGREHPYLKIGESLNRVWEELDFPARGYTDRLSVPPFYPCSLVTVLQSWEYLNDRQMSQATRTRLDIKYALHLPLTYPGIDPSMLCEFRRQVLSDPWINEALLKLNCLLSVVTGRETASITVDKMVASICLLNRADNILECMEMALEAVATQDPNWLKLYALPHWYRRYYRKLDHEKFPHTTLEIERMIESIGSDGLHLLRMIEESNAANLRKLTEIQTLENEWQSQFDVEVDLLKFRQSQCRTCSNDFAIKNTLPGKEEKTHFKQGL